MLFLKSHNKSNAIAITRAKGINVMHNMRKTGKGKERMQPQHLLKSYSEGYLHIRIVTQYMMSGNDQNVLVFTEMSVFL
jgi:hypothetical protein